MGIHKDKKRKEGSKIDIEKATGIITTVAALIGAINILISKGVETREEIDRLKNR